MAPKAFPRSLSILSVPTLCWKDSDIGNDTIHPELLPTVKLLVGTMLSGCWQLKKQEILFVNNLLERISVTAICPNFFEKIVAFLSRYRIRCSDYPKQHKRNKFCQAMNRDRMRHTHATRLTSLNANF